MTNGVGVIAAQSAEVNAKTFSSVVITDTESYEYIPGLVQLETVEANGVITPAIVSVGFNSPDFDNIIPLTTLPSIASALNILASTVRVPENTEIKVKADANSIATGNHKFIARIMGAYLP